MSTSFPNQKDSYTRKTDNVDDVMAAHINDAYDAVEAAEDVLLDLMNQVSPIGLIIRNNAATPNTQVDVDADKLMIEGYLVTDLNVTADITVTGANGRGSDESTTNSVFWYVWGIYNPTSSTAAVLLSQKYGTIRGGTNPTLPSGYTKKRLLGSVYRDASGNFRKFVKRGDMVTTEDVQILNAGSATSITAIDITGVVPDSNVGKGIIIYAFVEFTSAAATGYGDNKLYADAAGDHCFLNLRNYGSVNFFAVSTAQALAILHNPSNIYYQVANGTYHRMHVYACGYYEPV